MDPVPPINLPQAPPFNPASPLLAAQALEQGQTQLQMLNRQNAGQDIQFRNQLVANAAAHALDADSWDSAMRDAVQKGAPEAAQYIGRYTPLLQQRLFGAYSAAPAQGAGGAASPQGAAGAATPPDMLDRQYQNYTPDQLAQSLARTNTFLSVLATVKDQPSYDRAIAQLAASGFPNATSLRGPYNPLQLTTLWNRAQQTQLYLQNRVAGNATGAPNPLVKNDVQNIGNVGYSVDPYKNTATPLTPKIYKPIEGAFDAQGRPILYSEQGGNVIAGGATPPEGTVGIGQAAGRINGIENATGNPAAKNPLSSATGNGQFIDSTWLDTIKQARPDLAKDMTDKQLLALRADPKISADMTQAYATQNAAELSKNNLPITTATLALAHRFGPGDAQKILGAAPNTPLTNILSQKVISANPQLANVTAGQYVQGLVHQVGNDPVSIPLQIVHKGQFDKPQLIEVDTARNKKLFPGGEVPSDIGGTYQVLAQQDGRTGQWVTANEQRTPIDSTDAHVIPESLAAGGGSRIGAQILRVMGAARQATNEIANVAGLPLTGSTGWLGGYQPPHTLMGSTKAVLARKMTSQEVQDMQTSMIGLGRALAGLETMGLAPPGSLVGTFDKLAPQEGDTELTKMRKLGTMRQDAEASLEVLATSQFVGRAQKEEIATLRQQLAQAIPWLPKDVTALEQSKNPKATMLDFAKKVGLAPADQQALDWAKANPKDPRAIAIKQRLGVQ